MEQYVSEAHKIHGNSRNFVRLTFDSFFLKEMVEGADALSSGRVFHGYSTRDEKFVLVLLSRIIRRRWWPRVLNLAGVFRI